MVFLESSDSGNISNTNHDLPDKIADKVQQQFRSSRSTGKPTTRSNGIKEWTVLSAVVAVDQQTSIIKIISLSTGVKTQPKQYLDRFTTKGLILHDCHAEILAVRMFNSYLLNEVVSTNMGTPGSILTEDGSLKANYQLGLYISEAPCGDASLSDVFDTVEDCPENVWTSSQKHFQIETRDSENIMRGNAHLKKTGIVRTKPGRPDSPVSLSKSCSDKLCVKQVTGLTSCITSLLVKPMYLSWLILPDNVNHNEVSRSFQRLKSLPETKPFVILYTDHYFEFARSPDAKTCMNAIISLPIYSAIGKSGNLEVGFSDVVNNGLRLGCKPKSSDTTINLQAAPICSRRKLATIANQVLPAYKTYQDIKSNNHQRQSLKEKARKSLGSWIPNTFDSFSLGN